MLDNGRTITEQKKLRVVVVDDSRYMRYVLTKFLNEDQGIEIVGEAKDGKSALEVIAELKPDVVTLDVEMPGMDGLQTLEELFKTNPARVVMVSNYTAAGGEITLKALELGAIDFVQKPEGRDALTMEKVKEDIIRKIKIASRAVLPYPSNYKSPPNVEKPAPPPVRKEMKKVVIIGSSTGGPRALCEVFSVLPADAPIAVVVVQHMPPGFTSSLAIRLNSLSRMEVREAADGDRIQQGTALVAPGNFHLEITTGGVVRLTDGDKVHAVRPAIDITMKTASALFRNRVIGVILTGMGRDGSEGGAEIRSRGGAMIAQSSATCVVDGMPASLIESGNADRIVPLEGIAKEILALVN